MNACEGASMREVEGCLLLLDLERAELPGLTTSFA
jgi:hypothetical protein